MTTYMGECQLLGWSESHNAGAKLTLALPQPDDLAPFRTMTVAKGKQSGQVLACLMVEMRDGETWELALARAARAFSQHPPELMVGRAPEAAPPKREPPGHLCRLAAMWCKDARFQQWLLARSGERTRAREVLSDGQREELAADIIRLECGVDSRTELDRNAEAAEVFHRLFRRPYSEYLVGLESSHVA